MNLDSLKRFLKNKNTVTIIGVIAILGILYFGYSTRVAQAVNAVEVPIAAKQIDPKTEITNEMVKMIGVPSVAVSGNVFRNKYEVVGMYSNVNTVIPAGSMFYKGVLISKEKLPDAAISSLKKGHVIYSFPVDMSTTYGNSILPTSKIDIYMKVGNGSDQDKVMVGRLLKNVEVLAIKDSSGRDVFESSTESRTPSMMLFGLPEAQWLLLSKASYLRSQGVVLFPVPQGASATSSDSEVQVSTADLESYINSHSINIATDASEQTTTDNLVPTVKVTTEKNGYKATIKYPEGCADQTYVCTYSKNGGTAVTVSKTSQTVNYDKVGTLVAVVTEKDGTAHTLNTNIPTAGSNSNAGQAG